MATITVPTITAIQAQAEAFRFLNDHLPDRIISGSPHLDAAAQLWRVPAMLTYPHLGTLGEVGEIVVSVTDGKIVAHTPIEEMRAAALALAEQNREQIEAPVS
ncbi:MAG TPA: hypothetical protein VGL29_20590 [Blastocatellia bacterium]